MDATPVEHWLPVVSYPDVYEVSDLGRVRSLDRYRPWGNNLILHRGQILNPMRSETGHCSVDLRNLGSRSPQLVHRLVLEAFVGPCPDGMEGCHFNGDPADNRLTNLRWDTRSANNLDAVRHGTHAQASKTHCKRGHEFTPENTGVQHRNGGRFCRMCAANANRRWAEANRPTGQQRKPRKQKTHCKWGHEFTAENTYEHVEQGLTHRRCKACQRARKQERRQ